MKPLKPFHSGLITAMGYPPLQISAVFCLHGRGRKMEDLLYSLTQTKTILRFDFNRNKTFSQVPFKFHKVSFTFFFKYLHNYIYYEPDLSVVKFRGKTFVF